MHAEIGPPLGRRSDAGLSSVNGGGRMTTEAITGAVYTRCRPIRTAISGQIPFVWTQPWSAGASLPTGVGIEDKVDAIDGNDLLEPG